VRARSEVVAIMEQATPSAAARGKEDQAERFGQRASHFISRDRAPLGADD
jgi:hypothetical protein